jgi:ribosomal protein S27E
MRQPRITAATRSAIGARQQQRERGNKMKINCLSCGHTVGLDVAYDNYEGQVKCYACSAMLEIKTEEGTVKAVQFVRLVPRPTAVSILERAG